MPNANVTSIFSLVTMFKQGFQVQLKMMTSSLLPRLCSLSESWSCWAQRLPSWSRWRCWTVFPKIDLWDFWTFWTDTSEIVSDFLSTLNRLVNTYRTFQAIWFFFRLPSDIVTWPLLPHTSLVGFMIHYSMYGIHLYHYEIWVSSHFL